MFAPHVPSVDILNAEDEMHGPKLPLLSVPFPKITPVEDTLAQQEKLQGWLVFTPVSEVDKN
jgi:hypothetical protein